MRSRSFIDNSIQSYVNSQEQLNAAFLESGERLTVDITYRQADGGSLIITDNAMGMSQEELNNALCIGRVPEITSGLSEFGMGLKTAASWFGDRWSAKTEKLGLEEGHGIVFDVEQIASGNLDLRHFTFPSDASEHYTRIEIEALNRVLHGAGIAQVKRFLASMYRVKLRERTLLLSFNDDALEWASPADGGNIHVENGQDCHEEFEFYVGGKQVSGWMAILEKGSRANAGLTIIRRGTCHQGLARIVEATGDIRPIRRLERSGQSALGWRSKFR